MILPGGPGAAVNGRMTMKPDRSARPTDAELAILRVLWKRGPSTVRAVGEAQAKATGYTTTLKLLQIMAEKGLVDRDESGRSHVYRARLAEGETQGRLLDDLMERAFGGSAGRLVMRALASDRATPEDLAAIRRRIDELAGEGGAS